MNTPHFPPKPPVLSDRFVFAVLLIVALLAPQLASAQRTYTPDIRIERFTQSHDIAADGTYTLSTEVQSRVLTAQGVAEAGSALIGYIASQSTVEFIEAWTLLPDGTRVAVDPKNIRDREEDNSGGASEFSDERVKAVVFPQVQVGGAVGYRARIRHFEAAYPGEFTDTSFAYPSIPYEHFELRYSLPVSRTLYIDQRGFPGGLERTENGVNHYVFRYRRLEATAPESGEASPLHFADQLHVSTLPDMAALGRSAAPQYEAMGTVTPEIRLLAHALTRNLSSEREKAAALYTWVARNIRYVAVMLGNGRLIPHPASQVLAHRYGDCKDHAILLQALLSAVDIASSPALIGTHPAYDFTRVGVHYPLDHVITYLPSLDLYVDSTNRFAPFGTLSFGVAGKPVVLMALGRTGRTPAGTASGNTIRTRVSMRLQSDGNVSGTAHTVKTGAEESGFRAARFAQATDDQEEVVRGLLSRFHETGSGALNFPDPLAIDAPFSLSTRFTLDDLATMPGRGALRVPVGLASGDLAAIAALRPLASSIRPYPCRSRTISEHTSLEFPGNVRVTSLPRGVRYADASVRYQSRYAITGRTLRVERELVIDRASPLCSSDDLRHWLAFHRVLRRDLRALVFYR